MATSALSSLGLGSSGVLSYDTIDKLRAADESGILTPIDNKLTTNTSRKSDLTVLSKLTTSLESVTKSLSDELSYLKRLTTVSNSAVSVSTVSGSTIQDFSLHVNSLAQRDIYQSTGFESATSTFSTATTTTAGTVISPVAMTTNGSTAVVGVTESADVTFDVADMVLGDTITIGGLTLSATGNMTQAEVVAAFASLSSGATAGNVVTNGTWSGTLSGFNSSAASGATLTFASTTANSNVADLSVSTTGTTIAPIITTTDGVTPVSNLTESSSVAFNAANMSYGDTMTIGGLTLTATGTITQAQAIAAFASLSAGATAGNAVTNGTWSGTLTGFNSGTASGSTLSFTSTTANSNVPDLSVSSTQEVGGTTTVPASYTLSMTIGDKTYALDMTSGTTLTQLKDMINDNTDGKVTASILNVGGANPYKLILKSNEVGLSNAISFSSTSLSALKNLGLDSTAITANHLQTASDASFTYNGVSISRSTNTISDLINGTTITLNEKQADGVNTNISIKQDLASVKDSLTSLVTKYNELMSNLKESTKYDSDTKQAGTFQSTSQVKNLSSSLTKQLLSTDEEGRSIVDYGISLDDTGTLKFDSAIFDAKVASSATDVEDFFRGSTTFSSTNYTGLAVSSNALDFTSGSMSINGIEILFSTTGVDAASNALALKNAINAAGLTGIEATIGTNNNIQLSSSAGYDIVIAGDTTKLSSVGLVASSTIGDSTKKDGFFTKFDDLLKSYVNGTSSIFGLFTTQLETEKTALTKQRVNSVKKLDDKYSAMATKFAAYDSIISKLNAQFESLSQQIKASYTDTSS